MIYLSFMNFDCWNYQINFQEEKMQEKYAKYVEAENREDVCSSEAGGLCNWKRRESSRIGLESFAASESSEKANCLYAQGQIYAGRPKGECVLRRIIQRRAESMQLQLQQA